jgi:hypothetical protein
MLKNGYSNIRIDNLIVYDFTIVPSRSNVINNLTRTNEEVSLIRG